MAIRNFTGEELARALKLDLTRDELRDSIEKEGKENWILRTIKSLRKKKLFLIYQKYPRDGEERMAFVLNADDEYSARIEAVPFISQVTRRDMHNHRQKGERYFRKDCDECQNNMAKTAEWLNRAEVIFIGWANKEYSNSCFCI